MHQIALCHLHAYNAPGALQRGQEALQEEQQGLQHWGHVMQQPEEGYVCTQLHNLLQVLTHGMTLPWTGPSVSSQRQWRR